MTRASRWWGHVCTNYGRPRAYSLLPWRERYAGLGEYRARLGWEHSIGRFASGVGWCCPVCGDEWRLWVRLGGRLRCWYPMSDAESGHRSNFGPNSSWWDRGYRAEADAAGVTCTHTRIKVVRETGRCDGALDRNILLERCRDCGRVVRWSLDRQEAAAFTTHGWAWTCGTMRTSSCSRESWW
ncbi:hypothetical protein BIV57_00800 [Mangrovactinospora gilvigrisea]|uniref:Uncharacterized protein n=1 Tax=Mangrovactinospora gilvigrisea TaxID=1428644 RepID=A0A1J7BLD9_9ACTN|nr:hypothetical protein [Mangrovactinospora gilvigrisea]OIV39413.1 hypothetical protein BIV57_00800 [Mangrovactinospora gilvigrisea]